MLKVLFPVYNSLPKRHFSLYSSLSSSIDSYKNSYNLSSVRQPFHLVEPRPWPLMGAIAAFCLTTSLVTWFHGYSIPPLHPDEGLKFRLLFTILVIFQWWRDVVVEATFQGHHTSSVQKGIRWGIILFIASEVIFFFSFFWAFFHRSLAPTPEIGCIWPPAGIDPINPFAIPLLNTGVLLASGVTVTFAHHALIEGDRPKALQGLTLTVGLGIYFTLLQLQEYYTAPFTIADRVYGSTFFVATGFHGLHVIIGSTFLLVCLVRTYKRHFATGHHFGFEAAAWYWHFVDVVWLFLYLCIYWWGS